jgi:hypothetical protein
VRQLIEQAKAEFHACACGEECKCKPLKFAAFYGNFLKKHRELAVALQAPPPDRRGIKREREYQLESEDVRSSKRTCQAWSR